MYKRQVTVCEVSSFQLETVSQFHPAVAAVLNVTEDHLNRHGTMENYIALKERVFANCREGDFVVLNYDNAVTRAMAAHTRAKVVWFSRSGEAPSGALARDGKVVFVDEGGELSLIHIYPTQDAIRVVNLPVSRDDAQTQTAGLPGGEGVVR